MMLYCYFSVPAQTLVDSAQKKQAIVLSGSADIYFKYDLNKQPGNINTSFTNTHNQFALGMASVKLEHTGKKVSAVADLGFGPRAEAFSYNDAGTALAYVKQLYMCYAPNDALKFTAGTWATHVGYEMLDPQLNKNYSMSYLFTNGPFSHTGIKAEYTKGKNGFMAGLSNPTDYRNPQQGLINKKFFIGQYSRSVSENIKLYFNYAGGKAPDTSIVQQYDLVATASVNKKISLAFNASLNQSRIRNHETKTNDPYKAWWGAAAYLSYDAKEWFGLSLRSEWFNDEKGIKGLGTTILANTVSASFKYDALTIIPEIRIEQAANTVYNNSSATKNIKTDAAFIVAAVYKF